MNATAKDLRFKTKSVLASVARGEAVTISYHGRAVARLVPVDSAPRGRSAGLAGFGMWKDRPEFADPVAWVRAQRRARR